MDEMFRFIKNLTNKMSRFEIENRNTNIDPQEGIISVGTGQFWEK